MEEEANSHQDELFMIKEYYPSNEVDIKEKIVGFLGKARSANPMKTEDGKLEINEAIWMMEGASNYLMNVNLDLPNSSHEKLTMDIPVSLDGGTLKANESDIYERFNNFTQQVEALENDTKAKISNYYVVSSDNNNVKIEVDISLSNLEDISSTCGGANGINTCYLGTDACSNNDMVRFPTRDPDITVYPTCSSVHEYVAEYNTFYLCPNYNSSFFVNVTELLDSDIYLETVNHEVPSYKQQAIANAGYETISNEICSFQIPQSTFSSQTSDIPYKYMSATSSFSGGSNNDIFIESVQIGIQVYYD